MTMRRTTVFADEDDLAVLKHAAEQRRVSEAELIREAIHLAALAHRRWDGPFFSETFVPEHPASQDDIRAAAEELWAHEAGSFERSRSDLA